MPWLLTAGAVLPQLPWTVALVRTSLLAETLHSAQPHKGEVASNMLGQATMQQADCPAKRCLPEADDMRKCMGQVRTHAYPRGVLVSNSSLQSTAPNNWVSAPVTPESLQLLGWRVEGWLPVRVAACENVMQHDSQGEGVSEPVVHNLRLAQLGFQQLRGAVAQGVSCRGELICSMACSMTAMTAPCSMGRHASCMNCSTVRLGTHSTARKLRLEQRLTQLHCKVVGNHS